MLPKIASLQVRLSMFDDVNRFHVVASLSLALIAIPYVLLWSAQSLTSSLSSQGAIQVPTLRNAEVLLQAALFAVVSVAIGCRTAFSRSAWLSPGWLFQVSVLSDQSLVIR